MVTFRSSLIFCKIIFLSSQLKHCLCSTRSTKTLKNSALIFSFIFNAYVSASYAGATVVQTKSVQRKSNRLLLIIIIITYEETIIYIQLYIHLEQANPLLGNLLMACFLSGKCSHPMFHLNTVRFFKHYFCRQIQQDIRTSIIQTLTIVVTVLLMCFQQVYVLLKQFNRALYINQWTSYLSKNIHLFKHFCDSKVVGGPTEIGRDYLPRMYKCMNFYKIHKHCIHCLRLIYCVCYSRAGCIAK